MGARAATKAEAAPCARRACKKAVREGMTEPELRQAWEAIGAGRGSKTARDSRGGGSRGRE